MLFDYPLVRSVGRVRGFGAFLNAFATYLCEIVFFFFWKLGQINLDRIAMTCLALWREQCELMHGRCLACGGRGY